MHLVFIHGWGLDSSLWHEVCARLPDVPHQRIDMGFFGEISDEIKSNAPSILVGHSLGFIHGITRQHNWSGWIAINSFPRFVKTTSQPGCTSATELQDMRARLEANPKKTLQNFHKFIGAHTPQGAFNGARLRAGLDELREKDVSKKIAALNVPGLVLASRNDPLVPIATSDVLAHNAQLVWHETAGHMLPQNDPVWCTTAIADFLKTNFRNQ